MGTIGTGQADGAAEQTSAADAGGEWRGLNFEVNFDPGQPLRWLHVEGGLIVQVNPEAGVTAWLGQEVLKAPRQGQLLLVKDPHGNGEPEELPYHIATVSVYKQYIFVDGAAKEETAAALEADQPAAADGGQERTKGNALRKADRDLFGEVYLVEALLMAADLMLRMRHTRRDGFARRFLSMASAGEIARGNDGERIAHTVWAFRAYEEARLDERRQMSDLFVLHTTADDAELVEELRLSLDGVDTKINRLGIGPFTLQDFVNAGFPEADVELLRKLTMQAATRIDRSGSGCTAAQQQAQQQEGSAAHVG